MTDTTAATVRPDSFLTLHYRLSGADGDVINTFADSPATLQMGSGMLAEALEERLLGLVEGSHTTFELSAGSVFGDADPARRQWVEHRALAEAGDSQAERHVGEVLQFSSPDGQTRMAATVAGLDGPRVLLDFNHPLAGKTLAFEVEIIDVQPA